jgi:hypothetical protein
MGFSDNLHRAGLRRCLKRYSQCLLVILPLLLIVRGGIYAEVEKRSPSEDPLFRFGGFFAIYMGNLTGALMISSVVIGLYFFCYVVICLLIGKVS